jgi:hypothetical protein
MSSIEKQKNEKPVDQIKGLQVKSRITHSARLTSHYHYYGPQQVRNGVDSILSPYAIPVLVRHNTDADPIGRAASASYVSTLPITVPKSLANTLDTAKVKDYSKKEILKAIDKLRPFLYDNTFEGFGYIQALGNIVDEAGIQKVIDKRYHTISIGYDSKNLYCSECGTDILNEEPCKHRKGVNYGKGPAFLIFGDMIYTEYSYVNRPADSIASNEEIEQIGADSMPDNFKNYFLNGDSVDSKTRVASTAYSLYMYDSDTDSYLPQIININNTGETMKLTNLKNLEKKELLEKINIHLSDENKISEEAFLAMQDSHFVGGDKFLPANSEETIEASKKVLEEIEDSEEKTELLGFLEERKNAPKTEATDEAIVETTTVEAVDYLEYSFRFQAGNWGLPNPDDANTEKEKEILEFLLGLYATKKEDAAVVIGSILNKLGDEKESLLEEITKDKVDGFTSRIDSYKHEIKVLKDASEKLNEQYASINEELKDSYIEKILSLKQKESPEFTKEELASKLKDQSSNELRATLKNFNLLFSDAIVVAKVENDTLSDATDAEEDTTVVIEDQIKSLEAKRDEVYSSLSKKNRSLANKYYDEQSTNITNLKNKLKEQKQD